MTTNQKVVGSNPAGRAKNPENESFPGHFSILKVIQVARLYSMDELKSILTPVFRKNGVRKATLFGSYSKGTATPASDVDLMVDSGLKGLSFFGLLEDVCSSLDCPVDLIDRQDIVPDSRIDQEIAQTGKVIYVHE